VAKIKFDVSASDAARAASGGGQSPKPGMYVCSIKSIDPKDGRDGSGRPDPDRPMLEVVFKVVQADKKSNEKYVGSQLWSYLILPGHPSFDKTVWNLDQFLQAVGLATDKKRKGVLDTDALIGEELVIVVRAGKNQNDEYRGEVGTMMPYDEDTFGADDEDPEEEDDEEDEEEDDEEDEEEVEEEGEYDDEEEEGEYDDLSSDELRTELKERGLRHTGTKAALIARLEEDDEPVEEEEEEEKEEEEEPKSRRTAKRSVAKRSGSKKSKDDFPFED
jgi:hypothetical protein